jgi:GNAT superfamily N-acetyltransferase
MKTKIVKLKKKYFTSVVKLLSKNLTKFLPNKKNYKKIWKSFSLQKNLYAIVALNKKNLVIGYGSIFLEKKIRGGTLGHIEDIVIDKRYQSAGVGSEIIAKLTQFGEDMNCYKIALQCSKNHNVEFYKKCGYRINGFVMQKVLKDKKK